MLTSYRLGDPAPIVAGLARATRIASEESLRSVRTIRELPDEWRRLVSPRTGSSTEALLHLAAERPVFDTDTIDAELGRRGSTVYDAITRLEDAGIVHPITQRTRNRVWAVTAVIDELGALDRRIAEHVEDSPRP
jgi:hypothetical protein